MGDLPKCRVTVSKFPFESTRCDLLGPMFVKVNLNVVKRCGVLFICMATRACHIKFVPDLTTNSFIQCFWRFTCRRSLYCCFIYTDRGTNFIECDNEFKKLKKKCSLSTPLVDGNHAWNHVEHDRISQCMLRKGVDVYWYVNVAENPHAGGSWEPGIKGVKHVLSAILYNGLAGLPALKCRFPNDFEL